MIEASGGTVHWVEASRGVRLRAAHWPEGGRGCVLLLNGRTEFIEKHLETVAALQARGLAVWTLDWRGQGRSSRLLADPMLHHVGRFGDYLDDAGLLLDRYIVPGLAGRRLIVMGHSMGGHLAAHLLSRHSGLFARGVLLAPMIDFLRGGRLPRWTVRALVGAACLHPGLVMRHGPGTPRLPEFEQCFDGNRLTSCPVRHAAGQALLRDDPALALGGVTWGWLRAALDSVAALEQASTLRRIDMPVLVALAGDERVVDNRAARRFVTRLPRATLLEMAGARHELLREQDVHRARLWEAVDGFLAEG